MSGGGAPLPKPPQPVVIPEGDDMVGALPSDRPDDALREWILPGRLSGADELFDSDRRDLLRERPTVDRVPVAVEKPRHLAIAGKCLDDLLAECDVLKRES